MYNASCIYIYILHIYVCLTNIDPRLEKTQDRESQEEQRFAVLRQVFHAQGFWTVFLFCTVGFCFGTKNVVLRIVIFCLQFVRFYLW